MFRIFKFREQALEFSNETFRYAANRYANKFASFKSGHISIEDNGGEYLVTFEADNSRIFTIAGIIAGAITLFLLAGSNFKLSSVLFGAIMFVVISVVGYCLSIVSFPVYFETIRNSIERKLQKVIG